MSGGDEDWTEENNWLDEVEDSMMKHGASINISESSVQTVSVSRRRKRDDKPYVSDARIDLSHAFICLFSSGNK